MIVGAGLSAADAIVAALESGRSVLHVFRRSPEDPRLIFNNLPAAIYPEYHRIHRMMAGKESHPGYKVALLALQGVEKPQKKSYFTWRARRATFTF